MTVSLNLTAHIHVCSNIRNCVLFVETICLHNRITDDSKVIVKMKGNTYSLCNCSAIFQHETRREQPPSITSKPRTGVRMLPANKENIITTAVMTEIISMVVIIVLNFL